MPPFLDFLVDSPLWGYVADHPVISLIFSFWFFLACSLTDHINSRSESEVNDND